MAYFWKKYKFWLIIAILALFAAALFFLAISPLIRKTRAVADLIQEKIIDSQVSQSRISKIPEMKDAQNLIQEKEASFKVILDENNEVDFIKKLEAMADETGNKIELKITDNPAAAKTGAQPQAPIRPEAANNKKIDPDDIMANLPYDKYIVVQINLEGNYPQLLNFVHKLENMDYYVNVISISAKKSAREQKSQTAGTENYSLFGNSAGSGAPKIAAEKEIIKSTLSAVVYLKK